MWPVVSCWCWWRVLCAWRGSTLPRGTTREGGGHAAPWCVSVRFPLISSSLTGGPVGSVWPAVSCLRVRRGVLPVLGSEKTVDQGKPWVPYLSALPRFTLPGSLATASRIRPASPEQWTPTPPASGVPSSGDTRLLYEPALPLILARGMAVMSCLGEGTVASGGSLRASGGPCVAPTGQDKGASLLFPPFLSVPSPSSHLLSRFETLALLTVHPLATSAFLLV
jgi:hypothetical protein